MTVLSQEQIETFWREGCVKIADAVSASQLAAMQAAFAGYVEESRQYDSPYGEQLDGRPRFDLEPGHSAERPALRRVASPTELDGIFLEVLRDSPLIAAVGDLIGTVRFHHSKLNSKQPGAATVVKWHQDFPFDPHSNDDVITAILFLDDVTSEKGPLRIVPGSHTGPIYSHWQDGAFTGTISKRESASFDDHAVEFTGPAGSACIMHARTAHASLANRSEEARTLFIAQLAAGDAIPLAPNPLPSSHQGMMLWGEDPGRARCTPIEMDLPEAPKGSSFFNQQNPG